MSIFILKLKHWQIFGIWLLPNVFLIIDLFETGYPRLGFKISCTLGGVLTYLYYFLLSLSLYMLHSYKITRRHRFFLGLNILSLIFCFFIFFSMNADGLLKEIGFYLVPVHLLSALLCIAYATSNYRVIEFIKYGKNTNEYFVDIFLFFMIPYFIWITQPKLNKLLEENESSPL